MSEIDVSKGNEKYINSPTTEAWYEPEKNIIDGVCVAHCVHFTRQVDWGYCDLSNDSVSEFQSNCKLNKNCYYKQLQQLKQENATLNSRLEKIKDFIKYCTNINYKGCSIKCKYIDDCESSIEQILQIIEEE